MLCPSWYITPRSIVLPKLRCYNAMCNRHRTITQIRDCALCKLDDDEYVSAENPCRRETVVLNRSEARVEQFSYSLMLSTQCGADGVFVGRECAVNVMKTRWFVAPSQCLCRSTAHDSLRSLEHQQQRRGLIIPRSINST